MNIGNELAETLMYLGMFVFLGFLAWLMFRD